MTALLSINGVSAGYDRRTVISDVSIEIEPGEIVALIGHNGGGKTTLMRTIVGTLPARGGTVVFEGRDVSRLSASARVGRGLCLVPQIGNTFPDLTIRENLELSAHVRYRNPAERRSAIAEVHEVFPVLDERGRQYARQLSGGQRQMLALGIALLKQPRLLLLDEPSLGLSPALAKRLLETVARIRDDRGTTVLIVEQNIREVLALAGRAYVMQSGHIILSESSGDVLAREDLFSFL